MTKQEIPSSPEFIVFSSLALRALWANKLELHSKLSMLAANFAQAKEDEQILEALEKTLGTTVISQDTSKVVQTAHRDTKIVSLYKDGKSTEFIAETCNTSTSNVCRILRKNNIRQRRVKLRKKTSPKRK